MPVKTFFVVLAIITWAKCALLFLAASMLMPADLRPGYYPDSMMYEVLAKNLLSGAGFSLSTAPPYVPTMVKEPLFPVVIALFKAGFGDRIGLLVLVQMLVSPFVAILVYLIGKHLFDETVARFSALIVAVLPIYADMSMSVMPEGFFLVLFPLTIFVAWCITSASFMRSVTSPCAKARFSGFHSRPSLSNSSLRTFSECSANQASETRSSTSASL